MKNQIKKAGYGRALVKILLKMKLTAAILLFCLASAGASTYAQETRISISSEGKSILELFQEIEEKSEFYFFYQKDDLKGLNDVTVDLENATVMEILDKALAGTNLQYRVLDRYIIIRKSGDTFGDNLIAAKQQQQRSVSGTVTDDTGQPLPGVAVVIKGTTQGTVTNMDGEYTIPNLPENATLQFSFVGMRMQEIEVGNQTTINVEMMVDAIGLEEVVAVGYGTMKKSDLTGSIKSISMDDIPPSTNVNLTQSLRGYAAGLNVQGGTRAGGTPSLTIRGQNTLSASTDPLIVLDGIIYYGSISDINVADVERIDVLKDASAAAIYGSRSANGVLLITTKKGNSIKPSINFNTYFGLQDYANNPVKWMDAEQYAHRLVDYDYFQSLYSWYQKKPTDPSTQGGKPVHPGYDDQIVLSSLKSEDERKNYREGNEIDWIDEVTRVAPMSNYDLSIAGAGERFNYFVSASYTDQEGVLKGDSFTRTTLNSKVEGALTSWLRLGLNTTYSYRDLSGVEASMQHAQNASPLASKYNEEGRYPIQFNEEFLMAHPLRAEYFDNEEIRKNLLATAYAKVAIPKLPGLTYDFNYSNNSNSLSNKTYHPSYTFEGMRANEGEAVIQYSDATYWIFNHILKYAGNISENHKVDATLLYTRDKGSGSSASINANRFANEILGYNDVGFSQQYSIGSGAWEQSSLGYMARLNYIFKSKYLLTGTFRRDGFSGFGDENKLVNFYSLSAAWNLSEETFMQNAVNWLDFLKLRVSYGENGNQGIGRYSSLSRMATSYYVFGSTSAIGTSPNSLGNSDLSWETTRSTNVGVDYSILGNRISGEIDLYSSKTKDVLVRRSLPGATGYTSVWTNIGEVANRGIELELRTVNFEVPFRWESRFVFSLNRDELVTLYGDGKDDIGNQWFLGEPISAVYDYQRTGGVWTEEEFYRGEVLDGFYPGQFKLKDFNGDNKITAAEDRTIVGYTTPNYRFSVGNNISYKNFTLSFLLNSIQGGNGYYIGNLKRLLEATSDYDYAQRQNQPAIRENWTPDNGVNNAPAIYNYPVTSSGNYQDRSFVRLQDLSLTYRFNQNVLESLKIEGLQIYLSGKNLYTWTQWEGFDPELGGYYDMMMRDISLGVRLRF